LRQIHADRIIYPPGSAVFDDGHVGLDVFEGDYLDNLIGLFGQLDDRFMADQ